MTTSQGCLLLIFYACVMFSLSWLVSSIVITVVERLFEDKIRKWKKNLPMFNSEDYWK